MDKDNYRALNVDWRKIGSLSNFIKCSKLINCAGRSIIPAVCLSFLISCQGGDLLPQNDTAPNPAASDQQKATKENYCKQFPLTGHESVHLLIDLLYTKTPLVFNSLEDLKAAVANLHNLFEQDPELFHGARNLAFYLSQNANPSNEYAKNFLPNSNDNRGEQLQEDLKRAKDYYRALLLELAMITFRLSNQYPYGGNDQSRKSAHGENENSLESVVISNFSQLVKPEGLKREIERNPSLLKSSQGHIGVKRENFLQQLLRRSAELGDIEGLDRDYRLMLLLGCIDSFLENLDRTLVDVPPGDGIPSPREAETNKELIRALMELSHEERENLSRIIEDLSKSERAKPNHKSLLEKIYELLQFLQKF